MQHPRRQCENAMQSAYAPENACFTAISKTDLPDTLAYFVRSATEDAFIPILPSSDNQSKRHRGPSVEPGALVYVCSTRNTDAPNEVPIGIAVDGIPSPFVTASIQVSGVGSCRTNQFITSGKNHDIPNFGTRIKSEGEIVPTETNGARSWGRYSILRR